MWEFHFTTFDWMPFYMYMYWLISSLAKFSQQDQSHLRNLTVHYIKYALSYP